MLVIAMFCRKVNIPFVVYGFGNHVGGRNCDFPNEEYSSRQVWSSNDKEIAIHGVFLREYMNSKMSNSEFTKVFRNMVALMNSYGSRYENYRRTFRAPESEDLSNTPMNEAMIALEPITNQFRKVNNLDIVNTVLIHDGDADWFRGNFYQKREDGIMGTGYYRADWENVFVVDKKLKKEFRLKSDSDLQRLVMDWYTARTNSKIFGFFIGESTPAQTKNTIFSHYVDEKGEQFYRPNDFEQRQALEAKLKELSKTMRKEKFLTSYKKGYSKFFLICGGKDLEIDDGDFEFDNESEKVSARKLATAFMKFNEKRQVNRVLVRKFIEGIAV